jgi:hypothetical protein
MKGASQFVQQAAQFLILAFKLLLLLKCQAGPLDLLGSCTEKAVQVYGVGF